jgi:hypothetical protein
MTQCFQLALIVFCLCHSVLHGQSAYRYEASTGNYSELQGDKRISFAQMDSLSGLYRLKELDGEVFKWYNTLFKIDSLRTFHIQPYANLRFDNDSSLIIIDGAFTYLDSIDPNSSISYTIEGIPGNRLVKVQWKNLKLRVGKAGNYANLQIWVYQRSGVFEIHYGPSSTDNQSGFNTTSGPQVGIFYSLDNFTKCFGKLWVMGAPTNIKIDSLPNYNFRAMSGLPADGTVYKLIPRFKTLGLNSLLDEGTAIILFPNPVTSGILHLNASGKCRIIDTYGREVLQVEDHTQVDVSALPDGFYSLITDSGRTYKIIIQTKP